MWMHMHTPAAAKCSAPACCCLSPSATVTAAVPVQCVRQPAGNKGTGHCNPSLLVKVDHRQPVRGQALWKQVRSQKCNQCGQPNSRCYQADADQTLQTPGMPAVLQAVQRDVHCTAMQRRM
jgi:hypothetical protein